MKSIEIKIQQKTKRHDNHVARLIFEANDYFEENKLKQANYLYQKALQLEPKNILVLNGLGLIAMQAGMLKLAVEFLNMAWELNPDNIETNKNLAQVHTRASRFNDAILHYICMLNIDENNAEAHAELARLNLRQGNLDLALHHYKYAFELNPDDPKNLQGVAEIDASILSDQDVINIEKLLENTELSLEDRSSFYFSLGNIYDASGRYDKAFANYLVANMSKGLMFDGDKHVSVMTQRIATYTPAIFNKFDRNALNNSVQPVFVVGMPCSGISLVENMLNRKADVYSIGEGNQIRLISERFNRLYKNDFNIEIINNYSRFYLNEVNNIAASSESKKPEKIINTMPENYLYLGLIALLYPQAQIIHCVRNPFDVCLSSYFRNFTTENDYSYNQEHIALYFQQYQRLMAHWEDVLPIKIHKVNYEELIACPANVSKQLFEFINIQWQVSGQAFATSKNKVNIARYSLPESRQYKVSSENSRHYKKHLHVFVNELSPSGIMTVPYGCQHM